MARLVRVVDEEAGLALLNFESNEKHWQVWFMNGEGQVDSSRPSVAIEHREDRYVMLFYASKRTSEARRDVWIGAWEQVLTEAVAWLRAEDARERLT